MDYKRDNDTLSARLAEILFWSLLVLVTMFMCSCKTKQVIVHDSVSVVKSDTVRIAYKVGAWKLDTLPTFLTLSGDYTNRNILTRTDTIYKYKSYMNTSVRDSFIYVPQVKEKIVYRMKWYQKDFMWIGFFFILALLAFITYKFRKFL